jgi:integrase
MKSEHDYRTVSSRRFCLVCNPAAGIPTEPKNVDTRWLDEEEIVRLYRWLECPDTPVHPPYARAVRILLLTGQRVEEVARLRVDQWDAKERIINWDPSKPVSHGTLYSFMWSQRDREVIPVVTNRDLRRTWKTLAGKAGLAKEIRDRIQNHTLQDVSSKNYDRWNYMPEKRAAMKKWNTFVRAILSKKGHRNAMKKAA